MELYIFISYGSYEDSNMVGDRKITRRKGIILHSSPACGRGIKWLFPLL
jgi:hypothetical protein